MQSRRDQVQAHAFVMGRAMAGALRLEPDGLDQPIARTGRGFRSGVVVAVLIGVVVGLFGLIVPGGNDSWSTEGALVFDQDSGARYLSIDGVLHPVQNLTVAKLLAADAMDVVTLSHASLRSAPQGEPLTLTGAPEGLPDAEDLSSDAWTACSLWTDESGVAAGSGLALVVADTVAGTPLGTEQGIVVTGPDQVDYLLWHGSRLRLADSVAAGIALGWAGTELPEVPAGFLDLIASGPDLAVPSTEQAGQAGPDLEGRPSRYGQLFADPAGTDYLLTPDGLVRLTPALTALYRADPATQQKAYAGAEVGVGELGPETVAEHLAPPEASARLTQDGALPTVLPDLSSVAATQALCVRADPQAAGAQTLLLADAAAIDGSAPDAEAGVSASCTPARSIAIAPERGVLAVAELAGGAAGTSTYLVTGTGVKYPLPDDDAVSALGYADVSPVLVASGWLDLLPTGPDLTPDAVGTASDQASGAGGFDRVRQCDGQQAAAAGAPESGGDAFGPGATPPAAPQETSAPAGTTRP